MRHQDVLRLLWVYVHATRDDHVRLAIGEVQEVVGVEVADIAERAPWLAGVTGSLRLLCIVVVLELGAALEVDRPGFALWQLVTFVAANVQHAPDWTADGARVGEPLRAVAVDEAVALGARVVLVDDGAEPFDHLLLHRNRAWRGCVDDALQRRHVVFRAHLGGQLEHTDEHGGHDLADRRLVLLRERKILLGVEVLHRNDGCAQLVGRHAEAQRRCMVERRW